MVLLALLIRQSPPNCRQRSKTPTAAPMAQVIVAVRSQVNFK
jgi:hypothetical protein